MKNYDWDKLFTLGENRAKHFKWVSEPITKATVTLVDDDERKIISYLSAVDMAIGEEVTKNKHIITGILIGTVGTMLTVKLVKEFKKKYGDNPELVKESEMIRVRAEEVLSRHPKTV